MKLLVFAHTPPPVHGQSVMVQTLVEGLRDDPRFELQHINVRLSDDAADVGRPRAGKLFALLAACARAWWIRARRGPHALYYVPAPGRRTPFLRDLIAMALLRPFFRQVIFHWHAVGLGTWLNDEATAAERRLGRWLLGGVELSIVLAEELRADAALLAPRRIAVVPNGIVDPVEEEPVQSRTAAARTEVLFLGQCSREKGLFDTLDAVALAERDRPGGFHLTIAGAFASADEERAFQARLAELPDGLVTYAGFASAARKRELWRAAAVFCFPTSYPHEGQPLTIMEALAHDVPIITTRWRAIPGMLPAAPHVWLVPLSDPQAIAAVLRATQNAGRPAGTLRRHYLANFTPAHHLAAIRHALVAFHSADGALTAARKER